MKDLAKKHEVETVPVLAMAKDGKIQSQTLGITQLGEIRDFVMENLKEKQPDEINNDKRFFDALMLPLNETNVS